MKQSTTTSIPSPRISLVPPSQRSASNNEQPEDTPDTTQAAAQTAALFPNAFAQTPATPRPLPTDDQEITDAHEKRQCVRDPVADQENDALPLVQLPHPEQMAQWLLFAARNGWESTAYHLLAQGTTSTLFHPETVDKALACAVEQGHFFAIPSLVMAGASVDAILPGARGTPLMMATERGDICTMQMLLNAKAQVDATHPDTGNTALVTAIEHEHWDAIHVLMAAGADPMLLNPITCERPMSIVVDMGRLDPFWTLLNPYPRAELTHPLLPTAEESAALAKMIWDTFQMLPATAANAHLQDPVADPAAPLDAAAAQDAALVPAAMDDLGRTAAEDQALAPLNDDTFSHEFTDMDSLPGAMYISDLDDIDMEPYDTVSTPNNASAEMGDALSAGIATISDLLTGTQVLCEVA